MRIALVVPYFGHFNNYFPLVLKSCEINRDICDWIFFTDDRTPYEYPDNVKVHYIGFSEIKEKIEKKFNFSISLERPYKFCDYKPMYGYIFEEYLKGYDFWGHCDIDCIYGKFSNFFKEDIMNYDKVMRLGHLTLYRNTKEVNTRFFKPINGIERYKQVLQTSDSCIFDEHNAQGNLCIDDLWHEYGYSCKTYDREIANTYYKSNSFQLLYQLDGANYESEDRIRAIFYWNKDGLVRVYEKGGKLEKKEYMYIHLMKRKMNVCIYDKSPSIYKIIPNRFEEVKQVPQSIQEFRKEKWRRLNFQYFKVRWNNLKIKVRRKLGKINN